MKKGKYYKIEIKIIPQEIIDKYEPHNKQSDGYIYVRVKKGMCGLTKVGVIAHESLKEHLNITAMHLQEPPKDSGHTKIGI